MQSLFYDEKFEPFQTAKAYDDTGGEDHDDYVVTTTVPFKLCDFGEQPTHHLAETAFTGVNFDNYVEESPAAPFF